MSELIRTEKLSHVYSEGTPFSKRALDNVDFSVNQGELVAIIGHTGSGKSTLIQHLNGLLKPTSGKIFFEGEDIWEKPGKIKSVRFNVGLVFQYPEYQLFEETVEKDIAFGPLNMGLDKEQVKLRVEEAADFVGLPRSLLSKSPFELSGGQKRRAAIAGVMAMAPKVLIMDEPAAGLDPVGRKEILDNIKEYVRAGKGAVVLVTHSMEDAARTASRVVVMNDGKIIADGGRNDIFSKGEMLESVGLDVPQITRVFNYMRQRGVDLNPSVFTVGAARDEILRLLGEGGNA